MKGALKAHEYRIVEPLLYSWADPEGGGTGGPEKPQKIGLLMPQSHTHLRTLAESFRSNRSRPQKKMRAGPNFLIRLQDAATYSCGL